MFLFTFLTLFTIIHAGEYGGQGSSSSLWEHDSSSFSSSFVEYDGLGSSSSHSGEYGGRGGVRFSHSSNQLDGPITAIRLKINPVQIVGIQICYGTKWSDYKGGVIGNQQEIFLHPGESIIQVTGKYLFYVQQLIFITDQGRQFSFGHAIGTSFNAVPLHPGTVLRYISGRALLFLDAITFHWDKQYSAYPQIGHVEG